MTTALPAAVELAVSEYAPSDPSAETIVVLHGLFGSGRNWMTVGRRLAEHWRVLAPDLRNHGASPWTEPMTYEAMAADVAQLVSERSEQPVTLVGHSMGGKAAMVLALIRPELVRRLVVVDVAPITYGRTFRRYAEAMAAADLAGVTRRSQVDEQLRAAVREPGVRAFLLQNLVLDGAGARWRVNLPVLERAMETISGFPELTPGRPYERPVRFVAGADSDYLSPDQEPQVTPLFPNASVTVIPGAGHWVHAEQPEAFLDAVSGFMSEQ